MSTAVLEAFGRRVRDLETECGQVEAELRVIEEERDIIRRQLDTARRELAKRDKVRARTAHASPRMRYCK